MNRILLLALALVVLAPASAAPAATVRLAEDAQKVGPVRLFGDGAVWVSTPTNPIALGPEGEWPVKLRHGRPGRPAGDLGRVGTVSSDGYYGGAVRIRRLDVSGMRAALTTETVDSAASKFGEPAVGSGGLLVDLGRRELTRVVDCGSGAGGGGVALSWPRMAVLTCREGASTGGPPIEVRDLSRPGDAPVRVTEDGGDVRLAGTMIAWRNTNAFVVRDLQTGADAMHVPNSAMPGAVSDWDLQSDGKLAIAAATTPSDGSPATRIVWAAPGGPGPQAIDPGGSIAGVRIAGDRIAYELAGAAGDALIVRSLDGAEVVAARYAGAGAFDFDGERVAWARRRCAVTEILGRPLDGAPADEQRVDLCPLGLEQGTVEVDRRRRRADLGVACPVLVPRAASDSCRIKATLRTPKGRRVGTGSARVKSGESGTLRIRLSRRALRERPRRARLAVASTMRGGTARRPARLRLVY